MSELVEIKKHNKEITNLELNQISSLPIAITDHAYNIPKKAISTNNNFFNITNIYNLDNHNNSIFYMDKISHGITKYYRIRDWLKDGFKLLCENNNVCMNTEYHNLFENTTIKIGKNLQHELFVGIFCLNNLRDKIPNFAYILGGFKAKNYNNLQLKDELLLPISDFKQESVKYDYNNISHILYGKIFPSVTFSEYCKTCTYSEFLDKYLQVLFSLQIASETYSFSHRNLNSNNVLIYKTNLKNITYKNNHIQTNGIAIIINFDYSYVVLNGVEYYIDDIDTTLVNDVINDAYKLLITSVKNMHLAGNSAVEETVKLLNYFYTFKTIDGLLNNAKKYEYNLQNLDYKLSDFITYITKNHTNTFLNVQNTEVPSLKCSTFNMGLDKDTSEIICNIKNNVVKTDIFNFYDSLINNTQITNFKDVFLNKVNKIYDYIIKNVKIINDKFSVICIPNYENYEKCFDSIHLNLYKVFVFDLLILIEAYSNIKILNNICDNLFNFYTEFKLDNNIKSEIDSVESKFETVSEYGKLLLKFIKNINNFDETQKEFAIKKIDQNIEFNWYYTDLVTLGVIIRNKIF